MEGSICRAISFVSNHVPEPVEDEDLVVNTEYVTLGFFDGMRTKRVPLDYKNTDFMPLWEHSVRTADESQGAHSIQTVLCFGSDEWNQVSDGTFWPEEGDGNDIDSEYPLCFTVFLQLKEYAAGLDGLEGRCRQFNDILSASLKDMGVYYTYVTIDKNDFVVCIKSKYYNDTVDVIKSLHSKEIEVIYSYSVVSVRRSILDALDQPGRPEVLFSDKNMIYSICLKGVVNSYHYDGSGFEPYIRLDEKYADFCEKLMREIEPEGDWKTYDILGESDFRLVARRVILGKLLRQLGKKGMLHPLNEDYKFCFFISELLLNRYDDGPVNVSAADKWLWNVNMKKQSVAVKGNDILGNMPNMTGILDRFGGKRIDERLVTIAAAVRQLIYSLRVLEASPAKKYDFYSMYKPLEFLVEILEDKLEKGEEIGEYALIYDFIHKLSMTFHGTLRTDIQFFQIRDFNVVLHYAPAKLRAFYSLLAEKLSTFFSHIGVKDDCEYQSIVSPGLFRGTSVKQLFSDDGDKKILLLITIPEKNLYIPRWTMIMLTHEVPHFVGGELRMRNDREYAVFRAISRIEELEVKRFVDLELGKVPGYDGREFLNNHVLYDGLNSFYDRFRDQAARETGIADAYRGYARHTPSILQTLYREYCLRMRDKDVLDFVEAVRQCFLLNLRKFRQQDMELTATDLSMAFKELTEDMRDFIRHFQTDMLHVLIDQLLGDCKETFADAMAILTLRMSPEEYLRSFTMTDMVLDESSEGKTSVCESGIHRLYIVVMALQSSLGKVGKTAFTEQWTDKNIFEKLVNAFPMQSREDVMACTLFTFANSVGTLDENISLYEGLFDPAEAAFKTEGFDCLRDGVVLKHLIGYNEKCVDRYLEKLEGGDESTAGRLRKELEDMYGTLSGNDPLEVIQGIENYLATYEQVMGSEHGSGG